MKSSQNSDSSVRATVDFQFLAMFENGVQILQEFVAPRISDLSIDR
jgi:hypothetical protein